MDDLSLIGWLSLSIYTNYLLGVILYEPFLRVPNYQPSTPPPHPSPALNYRPYSHTLVAALY